MDRRDYRKEIIPLCPKTFDDVEKIVLRMQSKEGVIVDFENIPLSVSQRMLDFLSGAVFALGGTINKINSKLYILIPKGVKISSVRV